MRMINFTKDNHAEWVRKQKFHRYGKFGNSVIDKSWLYSLFSKEHKLPLEATSWFAKCEPESKGVRVMMMIIKVTAQK